MFKDKELRVRLSKKDEGGDEEVDETAIFSEKTELVDKVVKDTVQNIFLGIFAYVVLDTARQILVARSRR